MKFQSDGGIIYKYNHISCWRILKWGNGIVNQMNNDISK